MTLDGTDLTQLGRVFRNGIPSTWGSAKPFPSVASATTIYNYEIVNFNSGLFDLIQISSSFLSGSDANIFAVAYGGSYDPGTLSTNYLGDAGFSVVMSAPGPRLFEINSPLNANLLVVFSTATTIGFGTVSYTIEGFQSTDVPEPATFACMGIGLAAAVLLRRRGK